MTYYNCIWVATIPRTGSMWTSNIIKEIFTTANYNTYPKNVIKSDIDSLKFFETSIIKDQNKLNKYVLKIHVKLATLPYRSKIVTNIRNPYDICASYHEFLKCDLERSISVAAELLNYLNHYKRLNNNIFLIRYENIEKNPKLLIKQLAEYFEVSINDQQVNEIDNKFNKDAIIKLIKKNDNEMKIKNQDVDQEKIIKLKNGHQRFFDITTGFQSGHISKRKTGEWRKNFSEKETKIIIEKLDQVAVDLGYISENSKNL